MGKILFENDVCEYLKIPSVPKKEFDGKTSFKDGVAVVKLSTGDLAYATCTFNAETDKEPRIKKVFTQVMFTCVERVFVVPTYMNTGDIESADLDEQSKEAAQRLADEANELTNIGEKDEIELPKNEWVFDEIHNKEEAIAWIKSYNQTNKIRGRVPEDEETLKLRLLAIQSELKNKAK